MTERRAITRRRLLQLSAAGVAAWGMAGCGDSSGQGSSSEQLRMLAGGARWNKGEFAANQLEKFNRDHNDAIELTAAGQKAQELFTQQASAGNLPDLVSGLNFLNLPTLLENEWGLPLDELGVDIVSKLPAQMWIDGITTSDGHAYGFNIGDTRGWFMHASDEVLDQVGLSHEMPATWEALIENWKSRKVKDDGTYGLVLPLQNSGGFNWLAASFQGKYPGIEDDGRTGFNLLEGRYTFVDKYSEVIELLRKLDDEGVLNSNALQLDPAGSGDAIANSAYGLNGPWLCRVNNQRGLADYQVSRLPVPDGSEALTYGSIAKPAFVAINGASDLETIGRYFEFVCSEEYMRASVEEDYTLSVDAGVVAKFAPNEQMKTMSEIQNACVQPPLPEVQPEALAAMKAEAGLPAPRQAWWQVAQGVMTGDIEDYRAELAKVEDEYNERFDQALQEAECDRSHFVFDDWDGLSDYDVPSSVG